MSAQREVLASGPRRRRPIGTLLLAAVPLAIAAAGGLIAANNAPASAPSSLAIPIDGSVREVAMVEVRQDVLAAIVAPTVETDAVDETPQISISFPPEPEPEPAPLVRRAADGGSANGGSASSSARSSAPAKSNASSGGGKAGGGGAKSQPSASSYCSGPSSPYSPGGSVKGLLTAANKERARIGIAPLSWSGSLASAATAWSQSMASRDSAGNGSAIAHNPNRPGGENVAVSGSKGGMSQSRAINNAHTGWVYSYGHCVNLMNPGYSSMGAGSASTSNGQAVYTTANFT